jgi:type I restriction enzyme S subunit
MIDDELPLGWAPAQLGDIIELKYGKALPDRSRTGSGFPVYGSNGVVGRHAESLTNGETIIVGRKGSVGAVQYSEGPCSPIDTTYFIDELHGLPAKYWFHFLRSLQLVDLNKATAVPGLNREDAYRLEILVPPTAEQKRIADKLEAVLGRVDACRARLDRVPDLLKRFRQSVLAAAASGQLTEDWRSSQVSQEPWLKSVKHQPVALPTDYKRLSKQSFKPTIIEHSAGELPTTWSIHTVGELYDLKVLVDFADGNHGGLYPRKEEFGSEGALFLTATQMDDRWTVALDECPRLNWKKAKQLVKGWARNSDVLLSHNATVGRVGLIEGAKEDVLLGTSVTFYRFNQRFILPRYARIVFSSRFFQDQLESSMEQTTRDQVPITKQVSLNFLCAPVSEQAEIVRRVEALFALADRIEARLTAARAQVERLTPATLSKAFRGDLVHQDPNDEPASVLLERLGQQSSFTVKSRIHRTSNFNHL